VKYQTSHDNPLETEVWQKAGLILQAGLQVMDLSLPMVAEQKLLKYTSEMLRWNKAYNLTAVTAIDAVVSRHLLDSLSVLPWLAPGLTLDAGTGAGLPGIPLAIARPDQPFVLLDSNGKRMRFLAHIKRQLQLDNVELVTSRIEQWKPAESLQQIVTRAFAPLEKQLELCAGLLQPGVCLLAMTGKLDTQRLRNWPVGYTLRDSHSLIVPGTDAARHLLAIVRT